MRHLFTVLSAFSLILLVANCAMWVRSCFLTEVFDFGRHTTQAQNQLASGWAEVVFMRVEARQGSLPLSNVPKFSHSTGPRDANVTEWTPQGSIGHDWGRFRCASLISRDRRIWWARAPWWSLALVSAVVAAGCLGGRRLASRAHRRANHLCLACGYDLRATRDRCPECGIAAKPVGAGVSETSAS